MIQKLRKRMEGEGGFTLIELLVVIIIIAILAAIAIPTFLGQRQKAQDASAKSLVRNAMTAMESAYVDTRDFTAVENADLGDIEPSINFADAADEGTAQDPSGVDNAEAEDDQVVWFSATSATYSVGSESESDTTFGVAVDKGSTGGTTWYVDGSEQDW